MQIDVSILISAITVLLSLCGTVTAIVVALGNRGKTGQEEAKLQGEQMADLKHIKGKVDEVWADVRSMDDRMEKLDKRLTVVEESTKSAHKRIDEMKGDKVL